MGQGDLVPRIITNFDVRIHCGLSGQGPVPGGVQYPDGQIITRPMTFKGKKLFVNADVAEDGWIKAVVLTKESEPVASYILDVSIALTKDTTKGRLIWNSKNELAPPSDDHLRLVFQLKNAKLYSFWIE